MVTKAKTGERKIISMDDYKRQKAVAAAAAALGVPSSYDQAMAEIKIEDHAEQQDDVKTVEAVDYADSGATGTGTDGIGRTGTGTDVKAESYCPVLPQFDSATLKHEASSVASTSTAIKKTAALVATSDDLYSAHDFDIDISIPGVPLRSDVRPTSPSARDRSRDSMHRRSLNLDEYKRKKGLL